MAHQGNIGRLLWGGKYREAVELQRKKYQADPTHEFVPWLSALYSASAIHSEYLKELRQLLPEILDYAEGVITSSQVWEEYHNPADELDVISTVLSRLSDEFPFELKKRRQLLFRAAQLAQYGRMFVQPGEEGREHTLPLLLLTEAETLRKLRELDRLQHGATDLPSGWTELCEAVNHAERVSHPQQKERILRKIGVEYRKRWKLVRGLRYGIAALRVPHDAKGVKLKSLAALVGLHG